MYVIMCMYSVCVCVCVCACVLFVKCFCVFLVIGRLGSLKLFFFLKESAGNLFEFLFVIVFHENNCFVFHLQQPKKKGGEREKQKSF